MSRTKVATEVRERPILMSGPMVNAILRKSEPKTNTRRTRGLDDVNVYPDAFEFIGFLDGKAMFRSMEADGIYIAVKCPYQVENHLWVREAWGDVTLAFQTHRNEDPEVIAFRADDAVYNVGHPGKPIFLEHRQDSGIVCDKWKPSIFLPRWMSRITLEITNIAVERVQDISIEDIIAEGLTSNLREGEACDDLREKWEKAWDSINGKKWPFAANPWVWKLTFKRLEPKQP